MSMKGNTLKKLRAADDAHLCDGPNEYVWEQIRERVRRLKPELEQFINLTLLMDGGVQDASYVTGLCSEDRVLCIRFSSWGYFFTIWDDSPRNPLSTADFEPIVVLIEKHGFVHVNYDHLGELYDGQNEFFQREKWNRLRDGVVRKERASWWIRYFDFM